MTITGYSIGFDIDYDQIIVTVINEKTYEVIKVDGLNAFINTTVTFDGKEFQLGEKPWKRNCDHSFLSTGASILQMIFILKK